MSAEHIDNQALMAESGSNDIAGNFMTADPKASPHPDRKARGDSESSRQPLREGRDYTLENGLLVMTAYFLKTRGYCCRNGCRNCPYEPRHKGPRPPGA